MTKNQPSDKFLNAISSFKKTCLFQWLYPLSGIPFAEFDQRIVLNDSSITVFIYPAWFEDRINQNNVELPSFDPDCLFVQCIFKELRNEYKIILDDTGEPEMSPNGYLPFFVDEKTNIVMTWEEYHPILMNLWSMKRTRFIDPYVIGQELSWKTMLETELKPAIIYIYWCSDNIYNSTLMKSTYVSTVPSSILKTIVLWYRKKSILKRYEKKNSFVQDQEQANQILVKILDCLYGFLIQYRGPFIFGNTVSYVDIMLFAYIFPIFDAFPRDHEWKRIARHHSKTFNHSCPMKIFSYLLNLRDRWFPNLSMSNISAELDTDLR